MAKGPLLKGEEPYKDKLERGSPGAPARGPHRGKSEACKTTSRRAWQRPVFRPLALCMADIWVDRLSISQIQEISRLAGDLRAVRPDLTVGRLVERVREPGDAEIFQVVASSAARCAVRTI